MKNLAWIPIIAFSLVAAGCGCRNRADANEVVATINGQAISKEDYFKRLETMQTVTVRVNGQVITAQVAEPLSTQAMRSIIEEQLVMQLAKDEKVAPSEKDVQARKDLQEKISPDFKTRLKQQGWRNEDIDRSVAYELAREGLSAKGVPEKTLKDVEDYLQKHPELQTKPAQASFRFIRVAASRTGLVDAALKSGKPFAAVAAQYSEEPSAPQNNGAFPPGAPQPRPVVIDSLTPVLRDVVKKTGERKESDWIANGNERLKIYVESKIPETIQPPSNAVKEILRQQLRVQEGAPLNDINKKLYKKVITATIDIGPDYLKYLWEQAFQELKQRGEMLFGEGRDAGQPAPAKPATTGKAGS